MGKTAFCMLVVFWSMLPLAAFGSTEPFKINHDLGGVKSVYTDTLLKMAESWPIQNATQPPDPSEGPVRIRCWATTGNELYVGVERAMQIQAPMEKVEAVLDDINHYAEIFPGFKNIKILSRDKNIIHTAWEQKIPLPLVPNIKYELVYLTDKPAPNRKIYRYQLKRPTQVKSSDGIVFLESKSPSETYYVQIDFFDADWGPAKALGKEKLWKDAVESQFLSDIGIKLKAENPSWSYEKIRDERKKFLKEDRLAKWVKERRPFVNPVIN